MGWLAPARGGRRRAAATAERLREMARRAFFLIRRLHCFPIAVLAAVAQKLESKPAWRPNTDRREKNAADCVRFE